MVQPPIRTRIWARLKVSKTRRQVPSHVRLYLPTVAGCSSDSIRLPSTHVQGMDLHVDKRNQGAACCAAVTIVVDFATLGDVTAASAALRLAAGAVTLIS